MKDIISKRRKELGLTQQELADKLFVSDKVISKWETGKSVPDTSILVELANVLEISLDELLKSGKEVTEQNIKTAVADKVDVKYKNVLLFTSLFIVIGTVLFSVAKILDYKDYYQEYQVTITIFYVLAILFLISKKKIKNKIKQTSLLTLRVKLIISVSSFLTFSGQERNLGIPVVATVENATCCIFLILPIK